MEGKSAAAALTFTKQEVVVLNVVETAVFVMKGVSGEEAEKGWKVGS